MAPGEALRTPVHRLPVSVVALNAVIEVYCVGCSDTTVALPVVTWFCLLGIITTLCKTETRYRLPLNHIFLGAFLENSVYIKTGKILLIFFKQS